MGRILAYAFIGLVAWFALSLAIAAQELPFHGKVQPLQAICEHSIFSVTVRDDDGVQWLKGPVEEAELSAKYNGLWVPSPRFGRWRGAGRRRKQRH